jgi:hypothetical protein
MKRVRKPLTPEALASDIAQRGWAARSLTPEEYEALEKHYSIREATDKRPHGIRGRRVCIISKKQA